jgi:hypothetical protein
MGLTVYLDPSGLGFDGLRPSIGYHALSGLGYEVGMLVYGWAEEVAMGWIDGLRPYSMACDHRWDLSTLRA